MAKLVEEQDIEDLAVGAAILGTGGGGDPYLGKLMVIKAIRKYGPVQMLAPHEVPDDALVIPTAMMGAPTVMIEKIPNGDEAFRSLTVLEEHLGQKVFATMPIECGGLNSTIPFVVAAIGGLPIVDADGMGRAFPELQMETFHIYGVAGTPMVIHNERGDYALVKTLDNCMLEHLARGIAVRMGGVGHIAEYPMTGKQVKETAIPGTLSLGMRLGRAIREAHQQKQDPLEALMEVTRNSTYGKAVVLFRGKVVDVERRTTEGFARGTALVEGFDEFAGHRLQVDFQNENLIALIDGEAKATAPDLISFLDSETGSPITTEGLRYGYRVVVLGIPTPQMMRTPEALAVWGPRYFGYDLDYVPIEVLNA